MLPPEKYYEWNYFRFLSLDGRGADCRCLISYSQPGRVEKVRSGFTWLKYGD